MSEDSGQSAAGQLEEEPSPCASPTPSLTPSLPASTTPVIQTAPPTPCSEHSVAASSASAQSEIGEPPRPRLTATELESITLPELIQNWKELDVYTEWLDNQAANQEGKQIILFLPVFFLNFTAILLPFCNQTIIQMF